VGNYELVSKIGKGSFASVYKARNIKTGTVVALKVITIERLGEDERLHQNLTSEIEIMRDYNHTNICLLHEHFNTKKHINLVIEFCAGGDLQKYIRGKGRLREAVSRKFIAQLADGLEFLHSKSVVHRDIKSQVFKLTIERLWTITNVLSLFVFIKRIYCSQSSRAVLS
jgi:serine/threonine-protein kinase ULK2